MHHFVNTLHRVGKSLSGWFSVGSISCICISTLPPLVAIRNFIDFCHLEPIGQYIIVVYDIVPFVHISERQWEFMEYWAFTTSCQPLQRSILLVDITTS
ncbi:hypothetical protein V1478_009627 [Vespula squamosa]|uniref:Uncharacterized protein n=1 Tax=Vespula squamosa TaxID=30214 RepID=A0ABD2AQ68_VESSQ